MSAWLSAGIKPREKDKLWAGGQVAIYVCLYFFVFVQIFAKMATAHSFLDLIGMYTKQESYQGQWEWSSVFVKYPSDVLWEGCQEDCVFHLAHGGERGTAHDVELYSQLKQIVLVNYMKIQELGENIFLHWIFYSINQTTEFCKIRQIIQDRKLQSK